ncbi:hypothetical protein B488_08270 [Liberibacter crescens BT-1]|uniref:Uncharacterized protein n=1 Tax=Liberibacter crescens (strain BT-1) TaxID=1215343 RepID=L0ETF2_LIBCB|nr:hypothetical protein [Liberibacter crescens]AGA64819.1 hypothetical protein B488_08270 [Liberibacter crescens BT-1]AMC12876.1 hypothetical protein RL73_04180 [Liberibacter crescens]
MIKVIVLSSCAFLFAHSTFAALCNFQKSLINDENIGEKFDRNAFLSSFLEQVNFTSQIKKKNLCLFPGSSESFLHVSDIDSDDNSSVIIISKKDIAPSLEPSTISKPNIDPLQKELEQKKELAVKYDRPYDPEKNHVRFIGPVFFAEDMRRMNLKK